MGGQSIPSLDYYLAPYVAKSFIRNFAKYIEITYHIDPKELKSVLIKPIDKWIFNHENRVEARIMNNDGRAEIHDIIVNDLAKYHIDDDVFFDAWDYAEQQTDKDTFQAMESLVHNLCTMQSRAGNQTPFSSVNLGIDISPEGRLVTKNLFLAQEKGLGNGETAIFPISIMKMKKGVTDKGSPNYDLFKLACRVSTKRLFPNFLNLDSSFNLPYYKTDDPDHHVATMGCRTRVIGNTYDPSKAITPGRGNLFFITVNLPFIALRAKRRIDNKETNNSLIDEFWKLLDEMMDEVFDCELDRFKMIATRKAKNYPFLLGQHLYVDSENLYPDDSVEEVIKHGTLTTGFIGLAETLVVLTGKHHGESEESQELGLKIISHMNDRCNAKAEETKLNFSLMGSPAEGCCGRLLRLTKKEFGEIKGVTDHAYLTNSHHVPVYYPISAKKKIDTEAPYHKYEPAGQISYVEISGDPSKNVEAFQSLVEYMAESDMGYFSINHPVSHDPICGYTGHFEDVCPRCGRRNGEGVEVGKLLSLMSYSPDPKYAVKASMIEEENETIPNSLEGFNHE